MGYLIAGNWKMNGSPGFARDIAAALVAKAKAGTPGAAIALCPPAPLLGLVADAVAGSVIAVGAQDCHADDKGAHTGDVSAVLLAEMGCRYVIVGHSERRIDHLETDATIKAKAVAALRSGLIPIICVGETDAEREQGQTAAVIARQVQASVPETATAANTVIAYEPVWAIGTGKTATNGDIAPVHGQIRALFGAGGRNADTLTILYGGSVKGANAAGIMACPGVNGALVGGASLDPDDFWKIVTACP
jgi:triosephosphate isomerase